MKKKSSPRRDSETLEASSRAILSDDAKQKVADLVTKDDVTEPLFSVPTLEQIGKLAARGRYVDDSRSLAGCCSGRKLGNERANFVRHANMAGVALCGCKLQGSLPEGRLVSVRVRLQELLEDVRFHGASQSPRRWRAERQEKSQPALPLRVVRLSLLFGGSDVEGQSRWRARFSRQGCLRSAPPRRMAGEEGRERACERGNPPSGSARPCCPDEAAVPASFSRARMKSANLVATVSHPG